MLRVLRTRKPSRTISTVCSPRQKTSIGKKSVGRGTRRSAKTLAPAGLEVTARLADQRFLYGVEELPRPWARDEFLAELVLGLYLDEGVGKLSAAFSCSPML
jgi:hypothetical protein